MEKFEAQQYRDDLADNLRSARSEGDEGKERARELLATEQETEEYKSAEEAVHGGNEEVYHLGDLENEFTQEQIKEIESYVENEIFPFIDNYIKENDMAENWETVSPEYCVSDRAYCFTYIDGKSSQLNGYFDRDNVSNFKFRQNEETGERSFLPSRSTDGLGSTISKLGKELLDIANQDQVIFEKFAVRRNQENSRDFELTKRVAEVRGELQQALLDRKQALLDKKTEIEHMLSKLE